VRVGSRFVQVEVSGERIALFAWGVRGAVEELLEHGELSAGEALAGALCGGGVVPRARVVGLGVLVGGGRAEAG